MLIVLFSLPQVAYSPRRFYKTWLPSMTGQSSLHLVTQRARLSALPKSVTYTLTEEVPLMLPYTIIFGIPGYDIVNRPICVGIEM